MTTKDICNRTSDDDLPEYPGEGVGFQKHSEASKDGARAANPKKPTQDSQCLAVIRAANRRGAIGDEVSEATGIELYIVRARLAGLHKRGLIFGDGRRMGGHGVAVTVWKDIALRPPVQNDEDQGELFGQAA